MTTSQAATRETAAQHVNLLSVLARSSDTAKTAREQIHQLGRSDWALVCVLGDDGRLLGTLTTAELLTLPDNAAQGGAVQPGQPRVGADIDQEKMASIALRHGVAAITRESADAHNALEEYRAFGAAFEFVDLRQT